MGKLLDRFGRKIDKLRISVTDRCNFNCLYCIPGDFNFSKREEILSYEEIIEIVKIFLNLGIEKIRITGGEPFLRKNIIFLLNEISKFKQLQDLSITTNGFYLCDFISEIKKTKFKRINVSLDTLKRERFKFITGIDGFEKVIKGIEKGIKEGLKIKINVVVLRNINDNEILDFLKFGDFYDLTVRFIELMPTERKFNWNEYFVSEREIIEKIKFAGNIRFIQKKRYFSPNTVYFKIGNYKGTYGIIPPLSSPFCKFCNRIRLNVKGELYLCLASEKNLNLKNMLRKGEKNIEERIKKFVFEEKPESHKLHYKNLPFFMCNIGG